MCKPTATVRSGVAEIYDPSLKVRQFNNLLAYKLDYKIKFGIGEGYCQERIRLCFYRRVVGVLEDILPMKKVRCLCGMGVYAMEPDRVFR